MKNKLILYALHFFFLFNICAYAQDITPGYYRVTNVGLKSLGGTIKGTKNVKEECYAYVANGSYKVATGSGAKQNIQSMQMWAGIENAIVSPQTVVYIAKKGSNYNLEAQGTSVSQMTSYDIKVGQVSGTTDTYTLSTTVSGINASLWVDIVKTGMYNMQGEMAYPTNYQATTTSQGAEAYRQWKLVPISSSSSNYVAVNASLKVRDEEDATKYKYYAPYYASYPFKLVSPGMKAFYVSSITNTKYTLQEIKSEVIPAATPVIIECTSNNPAECKIEPLRGSYGSVSGNKLKGVYFCNLSMAPNTYPDCRTEFKSASMRVWAVKDDKLILTNNPDKTRAVPLKQSGYSGIWLRANESYLANVPSTAAAELVSAGKATTISFDSDGGTDVEAISGGEGDPVIVPANPTKIGYTFNGWNPTLPSVFPAEDMTVKAQWKINQYTITFNTNGGTEIAPITQDYQSAITKPADPAKTGYTFAGWDATIPDLMPAENLTINALWTTNKYTITFDTDGGTTIAPVNQDYGTAVTIPANPTKKGYTFTGWNREIPSTMPADNVVIKALWKVNQYTITFDTDGGSEVAPITQDYNTAIAKPANPTKAGSSFAGWEPAIPDYMPAENITVKALWTVGKYTIAFDTDGGTTVDPISGDYGMEITAPANPTKKGYTFVGWDKEIPSTMPAESLTIKALWEINKYTITFDTDGGSEITPITQDYNTAITKPSDPTKAGSVFAGWNKDIPALMPAESITIKALWNKLYTITFDTDGGSEVKPITAVSGTAITSPDAPTKTGYTFTGWNPVLPETMPASDVTYKAQWSVNQHKVTFKNYDGSILYEATLDYGAAIPLPANDPVKEGSVFRNWSPTLAATMPDEDVVYTATFDDSEYTITFNTDGGSPTPNAIKDYYNKDITDRTKDIIAPVKDGYTFKGWEPAIPSVITSDMTIKAQWQINQYTISFDTDGGSEIASITQDYSSAITKPSDPTKEGYRFVGWDKDIPSTMPAENMTVKAQWQINEYTLSYYVDGELYKSEKVTYNSEVAAETEPTKVGYKFSGWSEIPSVMPARDVAVTGSFTINKYTITFDTDGGSDVASITQNYNSAITTKPSEPTKEGYRFVGWDSEIPSTMPAENITIKALWQINQYTITFDTDGGSEVASITQDYNTAITKPSNPTKTGYTFNGWSMDIPSNMPAGDITIKAQWQINEYTITFDTDGGSEIASITQDYNSAIAKPSNPVREGYTFIGWDKEIPSTMPAEDVTIKAQWQINEYTLSYYVDSELYKSVKVTYNSEVTAEAEPEARVGYTFSGWSEMPSVMPAHDVNITGTFSINKYTITFDSNGGSEVASVTQDYNTVITRPSDPTKDGYDFAGWSPALPNTMPAEDMTLKAVWGPKEVEETYSLSEGWTWVSFFMINENMSSFDTVMSSLKWTSTDEIKGADTWAIYSAKKNKWVGTMEGFNDLSMYKIHSSYSDQELKLEGGYVNSKADHKIGVEKGWNYLAYLALDAMPVAEALQNYAASEGDILKSQTQSITYTNGQWTGGDLASMEPGKGYMLYRSADNKVDFTYPIESASSASNARAMRFTNTAQRFSSNMNVFATVEGVMAVPGDSIVAVAVDGVRGGATIDNEGKVSLTILGDNNADIYLTLMHNNQVIASAKAPISYANDEIVGTYANPTAITFVEGSEAWGSDYDIKAIYTMDGKQLPSTDIKTLTTGLYIIKYETLSDNNSNISGCRVIRVVR